MSKGTAYEQYVLNIVQGELSRGDLGIIPNLACVRHKPKYFSRDRAKDITFDISVEVFRKDAVEPYWIIILECKDYSHKVPVEDVEEFHAKLSQVGADRTKGKMVTPVGFGRGAVEFARSKGIGLCRSIPPGKLVRLLEDSSGA
ncbi:MAG: restriction endonuclease, partial [Dehalococcoidia bacterium]